MSCEGVALIEVDGGDNGECYIINDIIRVVRLALVPIITFLVPACAM